MRYVGLDVHKLTVQVCVLDGKGKCVLSESVACARDDLEKFCRQRLRSDDAVALEATTNTWAVVDIVQPHVERVVISNPMRTKAIAQAKVKTDKVDAEVLAQLLRCDYLPDVWEPDATTRRLRQLTTVRESLIGDRTRVKNRIQSLLATRLIRCPYAMLFSKQGIAWLRKLELKEEDRFVVDTQLQMLVSIDAELVNVDEKLQREAYDHAQARLLMTLPGVSYASALTLLAAIGDVSRFHDGDHLASYLGLVPSTRQSANRCYHGHITKAGNPHARWMLTQGVQHMANHPGPLGSFFRRLARRKNRQVAITATARKLVTIAYLMLKHNEPYRYAKPELVDRKYRKIKRTAGVSVPRRSARRSYDDICQAEGFSVPGFNELPAGERRMLADTGTEAFARQVLDNQNT